MKTKREKGVEGYFEGGSYYCAKCQNAHHYLSGIGRAHIRYGSKEAQREAFVKYGVY